MDRKGKTDLIEGFEGAYAAVEALLAGAGKEELAFLPPIEGAWSTNDHLAHMLDADISACFRLRVAVAEPGFAVPVWDEIAWQARLGYGSLDGMACLGTAKGLRRAVADGLRALVEADWSAFFVLHPERGRMGVEDLLASYRDHVAFHLGYLRRNREAFRRG